MVFVGDTNSANPLFRVGGEGGPVALLRISNEAARQLGLDDQQVVKGLIDSRSGTIRLSTDSASLAFNYRPSAYAPAVIWFRVSQSAYGVTLRPLPSHQSTDSARPTSSASLPVSGDAIADLSRRLVLTMASRPSLASIWSLLDSQRQPASQAHQILRQEYQRVQQQLPQVADLDLDAIRSAFTAMTAVAGSGTAPSLLKILWQALMNRRQVAHSSLDSTNLSELIKPLQEYQDSARLESLLNQDQGRLVTRFPLFFADAPPVEISLTGQGKGHREDGSGWRLDLEMLLLGDQRLWLNCLFDSAWDVQATAWTDNPDLARDLRDNVGELRHNLASFGLELRSLQVVDQPRPSGTGLPFQGVFAAERD